jgi:DNA-binding response OmpR family regulator
MRHVVLVIDDAKMLHRLVQAWLKEDPIDFVFAEDGKSGLQMALEMLPHLILLDVDLPEKNGVEICRLLKANPETANIPVIFLTAKSATQEKIDGLDLGADDYITKPFNPGELRARVKASLRRAGSASDIGLSARPDVRA